MDKFPVDVPKRRIVKALQLLGFRMVREHQHISMVRRQRRRYADVSDNA